MSISIIPERVAINTAAKLLGLSVLSVQGALQAGALDIGGTWKNTGSTTNTYYIGCGRLANFMGISKEELREKIEEIENNGSENRTV